MTKKKHHKSARQHRWDPDKDIDAFTREPRRLSGKPSSFDPLPPEEYFTAKETNAVVVSPYGVLAFVEHEGIERLCRVDDALTDGKTSFLCPGDRVWIEEQSGQWIVRALAERQSVLQHFSEGKIKVIAANIDNLLIVASVAKPRLKPGFIDRCLVAAEASKIDTIICLNKVDLAEEIPQEILEYKKIGIPVFFTSCVTGQGITEFKEALRDKTVVLCGQSGVGKSSLIKALEPNLSIAIGEVSHATEKGRHTTTTSRLYRLSDGLCLIDTPGVKTLGLWGLSPEELDYYFPEFREYKSMCRFRDCTHIHEPDCAVRKAVEEGHISTRRYDSYVRIQEDIKEKQASRFK